MVLTKTKTFSHRWKLPSCNKPRSPFSFSGLWNENPERVHLTRFLIVFLVSDFPENTSGEDRAGLCVLLWTTSTGKSSQESMQWISPRLSIREFLILNRFISQRFIIFMHQIMIYRIYYGFLAVLQFLSLMREQRHLSAFIRKNSIAIDRTIS